MVHLRTRTQIKFCKNFHKAFKRVKLPFVLTFIYLQKRSNFIFSFTNINVKEPNVKWQPIEIKNSTHLEPIISNVGNI